MASHRFQYQDRVKILNGAHQGRVGQIAQTTPDAVVFGVRFGPHELHFFPPRNLMKLKVSA